MTSRKNILLFVLFAVSILAVVLVVLPDQAHAAGFDDFAKNAGGLLKNIPGLNVVGWVLKILGFVLIGAALIFFIFVVLGGIFDFVVTEFVVEMGKYVNGTAADGIHYAWTMVRDIANIGIIAGLVATAIGTIIGSENYSIGKSLAKLLVAAILVNFSYFIAGAIIDASNFTAKVAYEELITKPCEQNTQAPPNKKVESCKISQQFLGIVKLENFWSGIFPRAPGSIDEAFSKEYWDNLLKDAGEMPLRVITYVLMMIVFVFVMGLAFLTIAGTLIARFVVLIILLVTSPIGIAGGAIPLLSKYSQEWWKSLWTQAFFAPVFFILAGISIKLTQQLSINLSASGPIGIIIVFLVAIAFLFAALRIAKELSAQAERFKDVYGFTEKFFTKPIGGALWRIFPGTALERFHYGYTNKLAPLVSKIPLVGSALDRGIAGALKTGFEYKPLGAPSAKEMRDTKIHRRAEVEAAKEREEKVHGALKAKDAFDRIDQEHDARVKAGLYTPGAAETERMKGMSQEEIDNYNKKTLGRKWIKDPNTGKWGWESFDEFDTRIQTEDFERNADGSVRVDQEGQPIKKTSWLQARDTLRSSLQDLPQGSLKELYHELGHEKFKELAPAMTSEQFQDALGMTELSRSDKDEIRKIRYEGALKIAAKGAYAKRTGKGTYSLAGEGRVILDEEWQELNDEERAALEAQGFVGEYTDQWYEWKGHAHEKLKRDWDPVDLQELIASTTGIESGLQDNGMFLDAITNENKMALLKSNKISAAKKVEMRERLFIKRYQSGLDLDQKASERFDELGITSELERDALQAAASLSDEAFDARVTDLRNKGRANEAAQLEAAKAKINANEEVRKAALMRAEADDRVDRWFEGKSPGEVNSEIKQEDIDKRLIAKNIRIKQLLQLERDQVFLTRLRDNIFTYGNKEGAEETIISNQMGQSLGPPTPEKWEEINQERAKKGLPPRGATVANDTPGATPTTDNPPEKPETETKPLPEPDSKQGQPAKAKTPGERMREIREAADAGGNAPPADEPARGQSTSSTQTMSLPLKTAQVPVANLAREAAPPPAGQNRTRAIQTAVSELSREDRTTLPMDVLKDEDVAAALDVDDVGSILDRHQGNREFIQHFINTLKKRSQKPGVVGAVEAWERDHPTQ